MQLSRMIGYMPPTLPLLPVTAESVAEYTGAKFMNMLSLAQHVHLVRRYQLNRNLQRTPRPA